MIDLMGDWLVISGQFLYNKQRWLTFLLLLGPYPERVDEKIHKSLPSRPSHAYAYCYTCWYLLPVVSILYCIDSWPDCWIPTFNVLIEKVAVFLKCSPYILSAAVIRSLYTLILPHAIETNCTRHLADLKIGEVRTSPTSRLARPQLWRATNASRRFINYVNALNGFGL
jgi:hypothetical protein